MNSNAVAQAPISLGGGMPPPTPVNQSKWADQEYVMGAVLKLKPNTYLTNYHCDFMYFRKAHAQDEHYLIPLGNNIPAYNDNARGMTVMIIAISDLEHHFYLGDDDEHTDEWDAMEQTAAGIPTEGNARDATSETRTRGS